MNGSRCIVNVSMLSVLQQVKEESRVAASRLYRNSTERSTVAFLIDHGCLMVEQVNRTSRVLSLSDSGRMMLQRMWDLVDLVYSRTEVGAEVRGIISAKRERYQACADATLRKRREAKGKDPDAPRSTYYYLGQGTLKLGDPGIKND